MFLSSDSPNSEEPFSKAKKKNRNFNTLEVAFRFRVFIIIDHLYLRV